MLRGRGWALVVPWLVLAPLALLGQARPAAAGDAVVQPPCDNAAFDTALAAVQTTGGGTLTFNCGEAGITFFSEKDITSNVTIDGGGLVTLGGGGFTRLFFVQAGGRLTLRAITVTAGYPAGGRRRGSDQQRRRVDHREQHVQRQSDGKRIQRRRADRAWTANHYGNVFDGNQASSGGALYLKWSNSRASISGTVFQFNEALTTTDGWGGAILLFDGARATIADSDFYSNTADYGGAIYITGNSTLTLTAQTRVRSNQAYIRGGGIFNAGAATLMNVTLSDNVGALGGGLTNDTAGPLSLINVTLEGNQGGVTGGGVFNRNGNVTGQNSTFSGNSAQFGGGYMHYTATTTLTNVTLSGNSAGESGGGVHAQDGSLSLVHASLVGNTAGVVGGGVYLTPDTGVMTVRASLIANSISGGNCGGDIDNLGFNLSTDGTCGFNVNANLMLGGLADNGGPTLTHLPLAGSPAIDFVALNCPPPTTDQRGATRPFDGDGAGGAQCDAGAVEAGVLWLKVLLPLVLR